MSRFSELKASGTGCARFSNSPIKGVIGQFACGGAPQVLPSEEAGTMQGLPEILLGLAVGAFVTYVVWERSDDLKVREAIDSQKRYQLACVRDFQNGWRYDKCEHDSFLDIKTGLESLQSCTAIVEKTNWTMDEFEATCGRDAGATNGK
ncbi:Hypothetical protein NGAL_HAMBI1145_59720 [Neorhizobium galegae bv. officinalis]|uniref:Uncharacterized protein n=2 Tax=Neorhizobium galegae TaxID=399 RepID=A0A0T7G331_NEOGA|nr:Hypothetical protein NGAL_HAMBI1145_59720 [Neorhizobium galegae bv. officinalis]